MDTDLKLRSMLEDVEVKPSRRVWKAVSERLDAEAAGAASVSSASGSFFGSWMKWAGASLALSAAAVAAVLYLNPAKGPDSIELLQPESRIMTAMLEEAPQSESAVIEKSAAEEKTPAAKRYRPASSQTRETVSEELTEENIISIGEPVEECEEVAAVQQPKEGAKSGKTVRRSTNQTGNYSEIFETQDSHLSFALPTHIYANGAIGGNSSDLFLNNRPSQMAPSLVTSTGITELSESTYGVPFTIGIGIRTYILPRLSFGTGLDYSLLTRTFSGKYTKVSDLGIIEQEETGSVFHSMSYLGIPLNIYYDVISSKKIDFYVYGGGEAEYCVANNYRLYANPDINYSSPVKKLQYSVGLGLGVEFSLGKSLGLYIDPEVKYYFHCNQPKNVRTEKPFMINFNAGLRFKL